MISPPGTYFVTFSTWQRRRLFVVENCVRLFLKMLYRYERQNRYQLHAFVVMPEHVHLLVSEPQRETLSTAIQALKLGVVRSMEGSVTTPRSRKIGETWGTPAGTSSHPDRFWQARFYDFNVFTERKRIEKLRYIHRNPVVRGLVSSPEDWPWSSFRCYLSGEGGPVQINDTLIMVMKIRNRVSHVSPLLRDMGS